MTGTRSSWPLLRLFLSATMWTAAILVAASVVLSSIYHGALERSFDRRLASYVRMLVADVAAPERAADRGTPRLGEPLFELPLSGWYWQIAVLDAAKREVRSSRSLWDTTLTRLPDEDATATPDGARHGYAIGPAEQRLRVLERTIDLGEYGRYLIAVGGDPQQIDDEMHAFYRVLLITVGTLAAVLFLITTLRGRFGFAPLMRISEALSAIRAGAANRVERARPTR